MRWMMMMNDDGSDVIKQIFVYPVSLLLGRGGRCGTAGGEQLLLTGLTSERAGTMAAAAKCRRPGGIDGDDLVDAATSTTATPSSADLLTLPLDQVLPLEDQVLGDLVADGELLNAKVVHHLDAQLEEGGHAEEAHQHRQVDEEVVADEADRVHVAHDLREGRLLNLARLLGDVRVEVDHAEEV